MSNLHGVETIELTSGTVAVMTIQTAIIGLVGTAPDASAGIPAGGTVGHPSWITLWILLQRSRQGGQCRGG
jgi:phage tail sheath protein FI